MSERIRRALEESGEAWERTFPKPKKYANGQAFGKSDRRPLLVYALVVVIWVAHDVIGVPLPSGETLDVVERVMLLLGAGYIGGIIRARRNRP